MGQEKVKQNLDRKEWKSTQKRWTKSIYISNEIVQFWGLMCGRELGEWCVFICSDRRWWLVGRRLSKNLCFHFWWVMKSLGKNLLCASETMWMSWFRYEMIMCSGQSKQSVSPSTKTWTSKRLSRVLVELSSTTPRTKSSKEDWIDVPKSLIHNGWLWVNVEVWSTWVITLGVYTLEFDPRSSALGVRPLVFNPRSSDLRVWSSYFRTQHSTLDTWHLELSTRNLTFGPRYLAFRFWQSEVT